MDFSHTTDFMGINQGIKSSDFSEVIICLGTAFEPRYRSNVKNILTCHYKLDLLFTIINPRLVMH